MNSTSDSEYAINVAIVTNSVSILVCLLAALLVFGLKLHKKLVYRLALYQVLAALVFSVAQMLQIIMVDYRSNPEIYGSICIAIAFFVMYCQWMKLVSTMWVTFHLFCFAVLHKNLKKLEVLYIVTSLLVPAVVASVPLVTHSYGYSLVGGCYVPVYANNNTLLVAEIETVALWDGPAIVVLFAASTAMFVMMIKLAHRVCWRFKNEPTSDVDQNWNALKQLLPLAVFPIMFFVFIIPVFVYDIYYSFITPMPNNGLVISAYTFVILWSMVSGLTLLVHIFVIRLPVWCRHRHNVVKQVSSYRENGLSIDRTVELESVSRVNSATSFSLPTVSVVSNDHIH